jgi:hypothetical protein
LNTDHEKALVSHVLSAPLTAFHLLSSSSSLLRSKEQDDDDSVSTSQQQQVCFVGARAEASLPVHYWRELLGLLVVAQNNNKNDNNHHNDHQHEHEQHGKTPRQRRRHYQLHFTGPELIQRPNVSLFLPPSSTTTAASKHHSSSSSTSVTLQWHAPCKFHEWVMIQQATTATTVLHSADPPYIDALICLNPGFGHPHLRDCWRPSLPWIFPQSSSQSPQRC